MGPREAEPSPRASVVAPAAVDDSTELVVAAYLSAHPDFMLRHPAVMQALTPPAVNHGRGVVDFQRFMVSRLQGEVDRLNAEKAALIQTVRANAQGQARIHAAALTLIEAPSLGQMIEALTCDLMNALDVDVIAMVVESNGIDVPHVAASGIRIVVPGAVTNWMGRHSVVLRGGVAGDPAIYGPGAGLIRSEALLRLEISPRTPVGLVAFGSRDAEAFQDGQGTEHLAFLGGVIERLLRAWLDLPA
jgi:uncharacterized protein YigA (DUF484 family)